MQGLKVPPPNTILAPSHANKHDPPQPTTHNHTAEMSLFKQPTTLLITVGTEVLRPRVLAAGDAERISFLNLGADVTERGEANAHRRLAAEQDVSAGVELQAAHARGYDKGKEEAGPAFLEEIAALQKQLTLETMGRGRAEREAHGAVALAQQQAKDESGAVSNSQKMEMARLTHELKDLRTQLDGVRPLVVKEVEGRLHTEMEAARSAVRDAEALRKDAEVDASWTRKECADLERKIKEVEARTREEMEQAHRRDEGTRERKCKLDVDMARSEGFRCGKEETEAQRRRTEEERAVQAKTQETRLNDAVTQAAVLHERVAHLQKELAGHEASLTHAREQAREQVVRSTTSVLRGQDGELRVEELLKLALGSFTGHTFDAVGREAHKGDFIIHLPRPGGARALKCVVDAKNYTTTVTSKEKAKLCRDVLNTGADLGMMISLGSGIAGMRGAVSNDRIEGTNKLLLLCALEAGISTEVAAATVATQLRVVTDMWQDGAGVDTECLSRMREFIATAKPLVKLFDKLSKDAMTLSKAHELEALSLRQKVQWMESLMKPTYVVAATLSAAMEEVVPVSELPLLSAAMEELVPEQDPVVQIATSTTAQQRFRQHFPPQPFDEEGLSPPPAKRARMRAVAADGERCEGIKAQDGTRCTLSHKGVNVRGERVCCMHGATTAVREE